MKIRMILVSLASLVSSGCVSFEPGISCRDRDYFAETPVIVKRGDATFIRWRYGSMGFYFSPEYKVRNGSLYFSLQATTSSGNLKGREMKYEIKGNHEIDALKNGGAYWWEPDKTIVTLKMIEEK